MSWHLVITEEMRATGLTGNDLLVFALIYGYSQYGQGCFYGSVSYITEVIGVSRRTALYILQHLVEKGLIEKHEESVNGVKRVSYRISDSAMGSAKIAQGVVQKLHRGGAKIAPNNIIDNINTSDKSDDNIIHARGFDFKSGLICLGVSKDVATCWMDVRKRKRAVNSEIAFDAIRREIEKSGLTPDQAIRIAVEKSWCGFEAAWVKAPATKPDTIVESLNQNPFRQ